MRHSQQQDPRRIFFGRGPSLSSNVRVKEQCGRVVVLVVLIVCFLILSSMNVYVWSAERTATPEYRSLLPPPSLEETAQQDHPRSLQLPPATTTTKSTTIPLLELVNTQEESECPTGLLLVNDTILDPQLAYQGGRHIPRIVHVTSKTRCMTSEFADVMDQWRFHDHSFFFHNEAAMERLLNRDWPEFPQLQQAIRCTKGGAGRADVWRALVLWEYGGIYTDIDNTPALFQGDTINAEDDAFFVIERSAILSQYFFAARPKHPLFYLLVQHMMSRLLSLNDVTMQIVSVVTGPGALRVAFNNFMDGQGPNIPYTKPVAKYWYPTAQIYQGMYNFTVRAVGHQDNPNEWVARDVIPDKHLIYLRMNMTYFREIPKVESKESCFQRIYKEEGRYEQTWAQRNQPTVPFY